MPRRTISLPLINPLNTRVSGTNPLPASSGVVGIGIVGIMVVGQSVDPSTKDARYVNCFKQTAGDTVYCVKRSGLQALDTPQVSSIGTAVMVWTGQGTGQKRITAYGAVSSSIYDTTTLIATDNTVTTNIGALCNSITETTINNTATLYITASNNTGWFYQDGGTITKITDAQYPGNNSLTLAGYGAHLDGYTFQMDTRGGIWNSDLNTVSSWTATGTINANLYPDKGIACVRWKQYIIGFGTETMEFFYNAGNATGSPLTRIANMAQRVGAVHADAMVNISDSLFFTGSTSQGGLTVYMWDGAISRISPPNLDTQLILAGAGNIKMTALRDHGLSFVIVKAGSALYAYCIEEKFWFIWLSSLGFVRFAALSTGTAQVVYGVSETVASGKTYTINPSARVFADDGMAFSAQIQMKAIDPGDGRHTAYEELQVIGDVETTTSPLQVYWTDDDYNTFSASRALDLSSYAPYTTRCGGTKKPRAFGASHSATTPMRLSKLRIQVNVGNP
jgi:hypothetical protein